MLIQGRLKTSLGALKDPGVILALAILIFSTVRVWNTVRYQTGIDFYVPWAVTQTLRHTKTRDIYSDAPRRQMAIDTWRQAQQLSGKDAWRLQRAANHWKSLTSPATPFHYLVFAPLISTSYERDYFFFQFLVLSLSILALWLLGHLMGYSGAAAILAVVVALHWFAPYESDVRVGNVNRLLLAGVALYAWCRHHNSTWRIMPYLTGAVLGFCVMFKPVLIFAVLLVLLLKLVTKRYGDALRETVGFAAAAALAVISSAIYFGSVGVWTRWVTQLSGITPEKNTLAMGNYAFNTLFRGWFGTGFNHYAGGLGILAVIGVVVWIAHRRHNPTQSPTSRDDESPASSDDKDTPALSPALAAPRAERDRFFAIDLLALATGLLVFLVVSKLVWLHYYVLCLPALVIILRPQEANSGVVFDAIKRCVVGIALLLLALNPVLFAFKLTKPKSMALCVVIGLILLLASAAAELVRLGMRPTPKSAPEQSAP